MRRPRIILPQHNDKIFCVGFSGDGSMLATACDDGVVRLWDPGTGESQGQIDPGLEVGVKFAVFSPTESVLAIGLRPNQIQLWDTQKLECFSRFSGGTFSLAFSPDGRYLACGGDGTSVWDLEANEMRKEFRGHHCVVNALAFSPDGGLLATACRGGIIKFWDSATFELRYPPVGHLDVVRTIAFTPDGKHLLSAGHDTVIKVWRLPAR